jgi:hypothetical protein
MKHKLWRDVVMVWIVLLMFCACGGEGRENPAAITSAWTFVDGNSTNGVNKDVTKAGYLPQLTVLGSKLYATWYEYNGTVYQIRVAVYNGNNTTQAWTFIDGNGANGINKDTTKNADVPQLTVFGNKLYATWKEINNTAYQIRVALYNGNDASPAWTFVDGNGINGINKDTTKNASCPHLTAIVNTLYSTWEEDNGTVNQIRVAVYNGNDGSPAWTFVDGNGTNGINKDTTKNANVPQLTVFSNELYSTWEEDNGTVNQIRVAVYNGNDASPAWTFVDGNGINGINKNTTKSANVPQLTVFGSALYATWYEDNNTANQIRVAVYNGNDVSPVWTFIDGSGTNGINKDATKNAYASQLTAFGNALYAAWYEDNGTANQIRVAVRQ